MRNLFGLDMTEHSQSLSQSQLDAYWMPFTGNRQFKEDPRIITAASGMYCKMIKDGRSLTACQGLDVRVWAQSAINAAIAEQAGRLDFSPTFQFGHPGAFQL